MIIGIDPGLTIGISRIQWDSEDGRVWWETPEQTGWMEALQTIRGLVANYNCVLAVEEFRLYGSRAPSQIGSNMMTSQIIGRLHEIGERYRTPVEMYPASVKPAAIEYAKSINLYDPNHRGVHALDAHAIACWALRRRILNPNPKEK